MPAVHAPRQPTQPATDRLAGGALRGLLRRASRDAAPDVARCSGFYGLFVEPFDDAPALATPNIHTRVHLRRDGAGLAGDLHCDEMRLPFADGSFALVYLACALETSRDAVGLAAECARLLEPEGTLLVLSLNPLSPARLRWAFAGLRAWSPEATSAVLSGLSLDVMGWRYLGARWSGDADTASIDVAGAQVHGSPLRSAYLLQARRRDAGMLPLRATPQRVRVGGGAPAASARAPHALRQPRRCSR
ncbi:MAG: methyltransferase domain-containing protein [Proteobacteria bacterium]|nr:methyltransferase domain-containing protein [Pseudomonadota bacterium]